MASVSERPTQVHPTTPTAARPGGLTPHEPAIPGTGGPGEPPRPPRRTGGGGGGGGGDHGAGGPGDPGRGARNGRIATVVAGVVLLVVFLVLAFGGGDEEDARIADTTPTQQTTPAPADDAAGDEADAAIPSTPAEPDARPSPTPAPADQDDSAAATTPQEETGGIAVGGAGQTGDAADSADAEAESTAPLLTAGKVAKLTFKQGETVRFRVASDSDQEVHVHGYDKTYALGAGETQTIAFPADLTGIFEVEFEGTGTQIGELTIEP